MLSCLDPVASLCSIVVERIMARALSGMLISERTGVMQFLEVQ